MGGAPCATLRLEHRLPPGIAHRRAVPRRLATAAALCRRRAWLPRLCCVCLGVSTRGKKSAGAGRRWCVNEWLVDAPAHAQNTAVGVSTRHTPTHTRHTCGSLSQRGGRPRKWCGPCPSHCALCRTRPHRQHGRYSAVAVALARRASRRRHKHTLGSNGIYPTAPGALLPSSSSALES